MKYKHSARAITIVSLIAITFVATVAATGKVHYPTMTAEKKGKDITFTILTDTDLSNGIFLASDVDPNTISMAIWDMKGNPLPPITPDLINIQRIDYTIIIHIVKQDGVPAHVSAVSITGNIITGIYAGDSFNASCPGWAVWNVH